METDRYQIPDTRPVATTGADRSAVGHSMLYPLLPSPIVDGVVGGT